MIKILAAILVSTAVSASAQGFRQLGAPKSFGGGSGGQCRQENVSAGEGSCGAPDSTPYLVAPRSHWTAELAAAGCSDAQREAFVVTLDVSAGLFNQGVLDLRRAVGMQLFPQMGLGCEGTISNWREYVAGQRALLLASQQDAVKAWAASCPEARKAAAPARRDASARAVPPCRPAGATRAKGACAAPRPYREGENPTEAELLDPAIGRCPATARSMFGSRKLNFVMSAELSRKAAVGIFEAQGGRRCEDTTDAYERYTEKQKAQFVSVMRRSSGEAASACGAATP